MSSYLYEYLWDAANVVGDDRYARGSTKVWYMRPGVFRDFSMGVEFLKKWDIPLPTLDTLPKTHILLGEVDERDPDRVWEMMQGEVWSPHGEAMGLIRNKGLKHTSMSVGDIVQVGSNLFMVDRHGTERIAGSSLRSDVVRLAYVDPKLRAHLLPLLRQARQQIVGPGGLIFNLDTSAFSMRTKPSDPPYNQTYDATLLRDQGKRPYRAALAVVQQFWDEISRMKDMNDVTSFVDEKVHAQVGKYPTWHSYSMPD